MSEQEPISNATLTRCQHCGKVTNYANDDFHKARTIIAEQREAELMECLQWYERYAKDVNRRGDLGHSARNAIANDGGKRARAILAKHEQS